MTARSLLKSAVFVVLLVVGRIPADGFGERRPCRLFLSSPGDGS